MKINSMSHSKSGLSCIYSPLIANRDFYWKHTMIKATQYFIDICWITDFDAKNAGWVSQDLSVHNALSVERIDMWLTP